VGIAVWVVYFPHTAPQPGPLTASGTIEARVVQVSPQVSGHVIEVAAEEGQSVTAGSVLVRLDDTDAQRSVLMAQNTLEEANLKVESAQTAYNTNADWAPNDKQVAAAVAAANNAAAAVQAAQSDYDKVAYNTSVSSTPQSLVLQQATNNYKQAKSNLDYVLTNRPDTTPSKINLDLVKLGVFDAQFALAAAQSTLNKMTLVAPMDGVILTRSIEPGENVSPGMLLFEIGHLDALEMTVYLPEEKFALVNPGEKAQVHVDAYPNRTFTATVLRIADKAEFTPRNVQTTEGRKDTVFAVRLSIANPDLALKPGMPADVTFTGQ
jgi:HlyD family secretion protein